MALAVVFAFLAACGFASGNVLVRVGTQQVPAPTATLLTVLSGMILVAGLALVLDLDEFKVLSPAALGWTVVVGIMGYPMARLFLVTAISMVEAARAVPMSGVQPLIAFTLGVVLLGERPNLLVTMGTPVIVAGLLLVVMPRPGAISSGRVMNVRRWGTFWP